MYIASYYGLTGFACVWYYRKNLTSQRAQPVDARHPAALGGLILYFLGGYSLWQDYDVNTEKQLHHVDRAGLHWEIGGVFVIVFVSALIGVILFVALRISMPPFFKRQTLTRSTPTLVPDTDLAPPPSGAVG